MIADAYDARANAERKAHYRAAAARRRSISPTPSGTQRLAAHPLRRFTPFQQRGRRPASSTSAPSSGAPSPPSGRRTASTCSRPPPTTPARLTAAGKRVLFASWSEGSSERLGAHAGRPRAEGRRASRPTGRRPRRPTRSSRSAWCCRSTPASRPTTWRSSPRPTSSATAWRGPRRRRRAANFLAEATALTPGRPRRPHRPRHRPLRRA